MRLGTLLIAVLWPLAAPAVNLSVGWDHSLAARSDGTVIAWGMDTSGQLGQGQLLQASAPTPIAGLPPIVAVAAGYDHALAVTTTGAVYAWGRNTYGQLGDGTIADRAIPQAIAGLGDIVSVAAGWNISFALQRDGTLWAWGWNGYGTLGLGTSVLYTRTPSRVPFPTTVVSVSASYLHALVLGGDGRAYGLGDNDYGQVGDGTTNERHTPFPLPGLPAVSGVTACRSYSFAIGADGSLWAWGRNDDGQLGDGTTTDRVTPVAVSGVPPVASVGCSYGAAHAVLRDGTVWSWGDNVFDQLARPTARSLDPVPAAVPGVAGAGGVAEGTFFTLLLLANGTALGVGDNDQGQVGDGSARYRDQLTPVANLSGARAIAANNDVAFALLANGALVGWGTNAEFQLAVERREKNPAPRVVPGLSGVRAVSAGNKYSLAVLADGSVWNWGNNEYGQLGDGTETSRPSPVRALGLSGMVAVSAGSLSAAALGGDGRVWAWGLLTWLTARLPDGSLSDGTIPVVVPGLSDVSAIAASSLHVLALKRDGTVWAFGHNGNGQLGDGTRIDRSLEPAPVPGLSGVIAVSAGSSRSFAVKADGSLWAWGKGTDLFDRDPVLGTGATDDVLTPMQIAGVSGATAVSTSDRDHTIVLLADGTLLSWGDNFFGQLGDGTTNSRFRPGPVMLARGVVEVSTGFSTSAARLAGGGVLSWGINYGGELGDGTFATRKAPATTIGLGGVGVADLTPEDAPGVPAELLPPFSVLLSASGSSENVRIDASVVAKPGDIGSNASVFVFALAPSALVRTESALGKRVEIGKTYARPGTKADPVPCVLAQLNASGQLTSVSASTMQAYVSGVLSAQGQSVTVLNGVNTASVAGATFYVGYGSSGSAMIDNGTNVSVVSVPGSVECKPQPPQTGWWWNKAEGGRGYSIETSGNRLFMAAFLYDAGGRASWYVASGATSLDGSLFTGRLLSVRNGQTLAGAWRAPGPITDEGTITLAFNSATAGTLLWPGGSVPIERFDIVPNGLATPPQANQPETGWWWNPAEDGRGFFIEWQNGWADLAGYMYDDGGNPIWYISVYPTPNPRLFTGSWWQYAGGQALTGTYRPATRINDNVAPVSVQFTGPENAVMTLPGGRQLQLVRFRF